MKEDEISLSSRAGMEDEGSDIFIVNCLLGILLIHCKDALETIILHIEQIPEKRYNCVLIDIPLILIFISGFLELMLILSLPFLISIKSIQSQVPYIFPYFEKFNITGFLDEKSLLLLGLIFILIVDG